MQACQDERTASWLQARLELEKSLGRKVFLQTLVKVKPNWREDPQFLSMVDWRSMAGI